MSLEQWIEIYDIITAYLGSVSPEFRQKIRDMKYDFVTPAEKAAKAFEANYMAPRLREAHRKGLEKGIEQILKAYISHHLHLPDETIAGQFNVSLELVQRLREELSA
jgi:nicotinamide riboside kinase